MSFHSETDNTFAVLAIRLLDNALPMQLLQSVEVLAVSYGKAMRYVEGEKESCKQDVILTWHLSSQSVVLSCLLWADEGEIHYSDCGLGWGGKFMKGGLPEQWLYSYAKLVLPLVIKNRACSVSL